MRSNDWRWRISCCGIFCNPQEGSESQGKVCGDSPPSGGISRLQDVQVLWRFPKRVLCLRSASEPSRPKSSDHRPNRTAAEAMQKHLWLSQDAALAGQKWLSQERKDNPSTYEKARFSVRNPQTQTMETVGTATPQIRQSSEQRFPFRKAQQQMGHGYLLHPYGTRRSVLVHDSGSVWQ